MTETYIPQQATQQLADAEAALAAVQAAQAAQANAATPPAPPETAAPDINALMIRVNQIEEASRRETGRLRKSLSEIQAELAQKNAELAALKSAIPQQPKTAAEYQALYGLSPEQAELGTEVLSAQEQIARKMMEEAMKQQQPPTRGHSQADIDQACATLDSVVPGWEEAQRTPEWTRWISDPTRVGDFTDAYDRLDVTRLAVFYAQFMSQQRQAAQAPQVPASNSTNVNTQVVPAAAAAPPVPSAPDVPDPLAIIAQYSAMVKGGTVNNDNVFDKQLQALIQSAGSA